MTSIDSSYAPMHCECCVAVLCTKIKEDRKLFDVNLLPPLRKKLLLLIEARSVAYIVDKKLFCL